MSRGRRRLFCQIQQNDPTPKWMQTRCQSRQIRQSGLTQTWKTSQVPCRPSASFQIASGSGEGEAAQVLQSDEGVTENGTALISVQVIMIPQWSIERITTSLPHQKDPSLVLLAVPNHSYDAERQFPTI